MRTRTCAHTIRAHMHVHKQMPTHNHKYQSRDTQAHIQAKAKTHSNERYSVTLCTQAPVHARARTLSFLRTEWPRCLHLLLLAISLAASPRRASITVCFILPVSVAIGQYHKLLFSFCEIDLLHVTSAKTILKLRLHTMGFSVYKPTG